MTDVRKNYELAFHINPNLEESHIAKIASELKEKLTAMDAVVSFAREPERARLSYEIKHNAQAYFGYIQFNTENTEGLATVQEYIHLNNDILRSIILRLPSDAEKSQAILRQQKAKDRIEKKARATLPKSTPSPIQNAALDKELEDIIEKL